MRIIDISRRISPSTAVWPGDKRPELEWTARIAGGSSVNVGSVHISTHTATHVDAPLHYKEGAPSVDRYDLEVFIGPALVWRAPSDVDLLLPRHVDAIPEGTVRLLVHTSASQRPDEEWSSSFMAFDPETILALYRKGVRLLGTDAPSFDPADSKELPAHHMIAECQIANVENLVLQDVADGNYLLVALPMNLSEMDAAPVRAVLIESGEDLHINVTARR
jgi:arylformamidase